MPMFLVRTASDWQARWADDARVRVALVRKTPGIVAASQPDADSLVDLFCIADDAARERLGGQGWPILPLTDGWYADDAGGGVAIWGQGAYWEIRDTPLSVKEAVGSARPAASDGPDGETLDVRRGIFGV